LASVLAAATPEKLLPLVGSGWSDTTRIASGDPQLWTQIVEENSESILAAMHSFSTKWMQLVKAVERQDYQAVHELLSAGKFIRDSARSETKS
jgi:prephenate dehydrogenase